MPYLQISLPRDDYLRLAELAASVGLTENEYVRVIIQHADITPQAVFDMKMDADTEAMRTRAQQLKKHEKRGLW